MSDLDWTTLELVYIAFGSFYSCNDTWCNMISKLQNSAKRRRERRRGCTCILRRPKLLRLRRKAYKRKCNCTHQVHRSPKQVQNCPRGDLKKYSSSNAFICSKHNDIAETSFCSRGTDTCCFQSRDEEIQGYQNIGTNSCCPRGPQNKNVCRFTVDAYFT